MWFAAALALLPAPLAAPVLSPDLDEGVFQRARVEDRLVLLDLGTTWCHACHVMEAQTYADPAVQALLEASYVTVHLDAEDRPDLAARYADRGWPATVIFDASGRELAVSWGHVAPELFVAALEGLLADPHPLPSVRERQVQGHGPGRLDEERRAGLQVLHDAAYDPVQGSWGGPLKHLAPEELGWAATQATLGDSEQGRRVGETLRQNLALQDPVWGGTWQHSADGVWTSPRYEKVMASQAANLEAYALGWARTGDEDFRTAALQIRTYLLTFLRSPEGAFFASQDADLVPGQPSGDYFALGDEERRALGVPAVDPRLLTEQNALAIRALCAWSDVAGDEEALAAAIVAARWVLAERRLDGGGFSHGAHDTVGPFLGDTVEMGRALLALYASTGDASWLGRAQEAAGFVGAQFLAGGPGFSTSARGVGPDGLRVVDRAENVSAVRFFDLLGEISGEPRWSGLARHGLSWLAAEGVAETLPVGGVLLADHEVHTSSPGLVVLGSRDDPTARALHQAARALPLGVRTLVWWDPDAPVAAGMLVSAAPTSGSAVYACTEGRCSSPATTVGAVEDLADFFRPTDPVAESDEAVPR